MKNRIRDIIISKNSTLLEVLKKMDETSKKLLIVLEGEKFVSLVSIGDVQRAIIKSVSINSSIESILRTDVYFASVKDDQNMVKERMKQRRNEFVPLVTETGELYDVIFWEDLFSEAFDNRAVISPSLPVVIMAGGRGSRLRPLTNVLPKPLIPINKKTIIEDIMDKFVEHGCCEFFISVNYKAEMIRTYLNTISNTPYKIEYIEEKIPLGTAGSLQYLKGVVDTTFFLTNCDIVVNQDYSEILNYHRENKNEITLVGALKHLPIPYGTLSSGPDGELIELIEKPDLTFMINSGMYILEPNLINYIPSDEYFHITELIDIINKNGGKVGVFPVSEKSWIDYGSLKQYSFENDKSESI